MAGGRGNAAKFKADLDRMVDDWGRNVVNPAVAEIVLDVRDAAEDNTRRRLGTVPGAPDMADGWFAGPVLIDQTWPPEQGGTRAESEQRVARMRPGEPLYVYNSAFYAYFHEKGYEKGPARWMLRDALEQVGSREVKV